jgi:hypothetical protein
MSRPLSGIKIAISISEAENLSDFGFTGDDRHSPINLVTVELCHRLVALGAQVVLGHQWRPNGVMEAVSLFAQAYQWEAGASKEPIIYNFLAWPDRAALSEGDRKQLGSLVAIDEGEEPSSSPELEPRIMALREMRKKMAVTADARICLSGKLHQPDKRFVSGPLEEAALMIMQEKPVYLSRMMGGAAALLIDLLRGENADPRQASIVGDAVTTEYYLSWFRRPASLEELTEFCGLDPDELNELFEAQNLDTVIQLTSRGIAKRVHGSKSGRVPPH